ncbi:MAG: S1C family serine protease [Hyphomicrobiaceae bacterium]|nr:S1C family serine protease [Hyphomicrobiaceae bacterium]
MQPNPQDYDYDLVRALGAVVNVRAIVPPDAFTAETLGTERAGNGVIIRPDGLVLTIGYLVTEAHTVWVTLAGGRVVQGHVVAFDQETGFGLVQLLARLEVTPLLVGSSAAARVGDDVVVAGGGGIAHAEAARIIAKQEFAGYWEYVLDEAIFTAPAHPNWGGTALLNADGELIGIGSLQIQRSSGGRDLEDANMIVPIDLLKPILDDLVMLGRPNRPPRPWLGLYASELEGGVAVLGVAAKGPANDARLQVGDVILDVAGGKVSSLADLFRRVWSLGPAGVEVPLTISREGRVRSLNVHSGDRRDFLKGPVLH